MHMNGNQLTLPVSMWGSHHSCCLKVRMDFYGVTTRMFDDDADVPTRHEYVYVSVPQAFYESVTLHSTAQVAELEAWTREHAPLLVAALQESLTYRHRKVLDRVPSLLSANGLAGLKVVLRVRDTRFQTSLFFILYIIY